MNVILSKRLLLWVAWLLMFADVALSEPLMVEQRHIEAFKDRQQVIHYRPSSAYESRFFVESNLEFTLLHELSHAVIELNGIPVLGGHERAADQIAIMLMIMTSEGFDEALFDKMLSISGEWMIEWRDEINRHPLAFWDVHPLSIQRFYDVTCLLYGAAPDKLEQIRQETWLPMERAWDCDKEYLKNRQALLWLAENYSYVSFDKNWQLFQREARKDNNKVVSLEFVPTSNVAYQPILEWLVSSQRLNYLIERTNKILKLPVPVTIYFETQCSGPDAWWNPKINSIIICYSLIEQFQNNAEKLQPLVKRLRNESELPFLFLFPEKYSGLLAQDREAVRLQFIKLMERIMVEEH